MKTGNRQSKRIEKAIDEIIKVGDDGYGTKLLQEVLIMLNSQLNRFNDPEWDIPMSNYRKK